MEAFYGWIRNIVCYLCLFNIFLQILPTGSFKKYVRFFGGLLLMVLVLGPLADVTHLAAGFERAWNMESLREQAAELRLTGEGMEELRSEKINEAYQAEMKRQVEEVVRTYGMMPERTELTFSREDGGFLNIEEAILTVSGNRGTYSSATSEIKKELQEVYHISSEHINISIQE